MLQYNAQQSQEQNHGLRKVSCFEDLGQFESDSLIQLRKTRERAKHAALVPANASLNTTLALCVELSVIKVIRDGNNGLRVCWNLISQNRRESPSYANINILKI